MVHSSQRWLGSINPAGPSDAVLSAFQARSSGWQFLTLADKAISQYFFSSQVFGLVKKPLPLKNESLQPLLHALPLPLPSLVPALPKHVKVEEQDSRTGRRQTQSEPSQSFKVFPLFLCVFCWRCQKQLFVIQQFLKPYSCK